MNHEKSKLVTPSDKAIVGIKGKDGEIIPCTHINRATDGLGEQIVVCQASDDSRILEKNLDR